MSIMTATSRTRPMPAPITTVGNRLLATVAIALNVIDALTTWIALTYTGAVEANPLVGTVMERIGTAPALATKILVISLVIAMVAWARTHGSVVARYGLPGAAIGLGAVVTSNSLLLWHALV